VPVAQPPEVHVQFYFSPITTFGFIAAQALAVLDPPLG